MEDYCKIFINFDELDVYNLQKCQTFFIFDFA